MSFMKSVPMTCWAIIAGKHPHHVTITWLLMIQFFFSPFFNLHFFPYLFIFFSYLLLFFLFFFLTFCYFSISTKSNTSEEFIVSINTINTTSIKTSPLVPQRPLIHPPQLPQSSVNQLNPIANFSKDFHKSSSSSLKRRKKTNVV